MTSKTIEEVSIEIRYIKELLEKEFELNRKTHERMIEKQNITNGNIIRHEDRLGNIEILQREHRKNHKDSDSTRRSWIQWIPAIIIVILTGINVYASLK